VCRETSLIDRVTRLVIGLAQALAQHAVQILAVPIDLQDALLQQVNAIVTVEKSDNSA
jgi:hypothetical protein